MKLTASLTVMIFSAASSGISQPNSSSNAITSSTVSRLSAPRSSMKLAFSVTFDSSTPRCSTTIFFTRSATSLIRIVPQWLIGRCSRFSAVRVSDRGISRLRVAIAAALKGGGSHNTNSAGVPIRGTAQPRALYHAHPAVDMQRLSGDVGGLGAGEVNRGGGDLLGRAEALHGNRRHEPGALVVAQLIGHRRPDEARRDAVDGDAAGRDLGGDRFRHGDHRGFRGGVIRLAGIAGDPADRADRDDPAVAAAQHAAQRGADQAKPGGEVDLQHRLPIPVAHAHRKPVAGDSGIVDQDVELAERRLRLADQALRLVGLGKIGGEDMSALAKFGGERRQRRFARAGEHDGGALGVQRAGDRPADAAPRVGDKGFLAGEIEHHSRFISASVSAAVPTEDASNSRSMRRASPASTRPAPISTISSTSCSLKSNTVSRQRTSRITCSTSISRISPGSLTGEAVTLATTGTRGGFNATSASASSMISAAGAISGQWNGALTGSMIERRAPRSAASATPRSPAARWPLTTICPGDLSWATPLRPYPAVPAATSRAASISRPSSAAIAPSPTGTAFCIARPRRLTRRTASGTEKAPAAARAEYC